MTTIPITPQSCPFQPQASIVLTDDLVLAGFANVDVLNKKCQDIESHHLKFQDIRRKAKIIYQHPKYHTEFMEAPLFYMEGGFLYVRYAEHASELQNDFPLLRRPPGDAIYWESRLG
jgi:hypothetical protein